MVVAGFCECPSGVFNAVACVDRVFCCCDVWCIRCMLGTRLVADKVCGTADIQGSLQMSGSSLKSKVAKGAVWTLLEKLSTQAVQFVVGMVLARLLTPNDYGTVALRTGGNLVCWRGVMAGKAIGVL